jgi:hypothetical protein
MSIAIHPNNHFYRLIGVQQDQQNLAAMMKGEQSFKPPSETREAAP